VFAENVPGDTTVVVGTYATPYAEVLSQPALQTSGYPVGTPETESVAFAGPPRTFPDREAVHWEPGERPVCVKETVTPVPVNGDVTTTWDHE
jgi:hypothetical protein